MNLENLDPRKLSVNITHDSYPIPGTENQEWVHKSYTELWYNGKLMSKNEIKEPIQQWGDGD